MLTRHGDPVALPVSMVEVRRGSSRPPLYFPPGALGEIVLSEELVSELPADLPLYAFRDAIDDGPRAPSMEAMAGRLSADLTAFQPDGPICLAGYSFAGLLAYEMARQLTAAGREIKLLVIFDTGPDLSAGGSPSHMVMRVLLCLENAPRWVAEDLIRSSSRETLERLWRSVRKLARSWAGRPGSAVPGVVARVEHLFDVSTWSPALYAHVDNNLRILSAFRYGTYSGSVILFRARVRPLFHAHTADLGWRSLAGDVRVIETPGNHHTLMLAPHIQVVARKLREVVEE